MDNKAVTGMTNVQGAPVVDNMMKGITNITLRMNNNASYDDPPFVINVNNMTVIQKKFSLKNIQSLGTGSAAQKQGLNPYNDIRSSGSGSTPNQGQNLPNDTTETNETAAAGLFIFDNTDSYDNDTAPGVYLRWESDKGRADIPVGELENILGNSTDCFTTVVCLPFIK